MKTCAHTIGRAVTSLAIVATTLASGATAAGATVPRDPGGGGVACPAAHVVGDWFNGQLSGTVSDIPNGTLRNDAIRSPNRRYLFVMQSDGNLVLYDCTGHRVCWASGTNGKSGAYAQFRLITTTGAGNAT